MKKRRPSSSTTASQVESLGQLTQKAAAHLLNRSVRWLRDQPAPQNQDGTYSGPVLVSWFLERERQSSVADPLLVASNPSPALERYRSEKAELAKLDRCERQRDLLPRQQVHDLLSEWAGLIRHASEKLHRRFGSDASDVIHESLDRMGQLIDRVAGN